ncbi:PucR family transcriptional regulator [Saccharibacillus sp. JS10]|uniref:PucR family transcriptional regulator n=1 Tax=Saccharibacillus sp. JS10 TaxID=2950552 RepID=UPI00210AED6A|nr:PucR family transcriptional regulator [Saccharibacillus sp. JS10]MCQ4088316.1 PucR family transcriptional regulator ligand-binding domain-containing protein [Saccharibacillus sp. JS10]
MTTIAEILSLPRYSDLKLLTSPRSVDIHKNIQSVEISETPDIEHYISSDVLLLTTAMTYADDQQGLISLIDSLIRAKAVGLGIKTGRFLGEIDPAVIAYAENADFPLIDIPNTYSLGSLLHQLLNKIWGTQYEEISFALDIQKKFFSLLVQNANNKVVINKLSEIVKTPIILLNPFKEIMDHSKQFTYSRNPAQHYVNEIVQRKPVLSKQNDSFIISAPDGREIQVSIIPIHVHTYFPHYLVIVNPEQIPYPISSFAIDQAAMVLSFVLFKNEKVSESQQSIATEYFKELIDHHSSATATPQSFELNTKYGYILSDHYQVVHVFDEKAIEDTLPRLEQEERLILSAQWLQKQVAELFPNSLILFFSTSKETILLIQRETSDMDQKLLNLRQALIENLDIALMFSVGNPYTDWKRINQSYTEARIVFDERKNKQQPQPIIHYKDKGMVQLFHHLEKNDVRFFCENILKDFAYPKEPAMVELRKTLSVYLGAQCEIASAAAMLFVHRNTVKYRILRCEEILGHAVNSPSHSLNLRLALALSDDNH